MTKAPRIKWRKALKALAVMGWVEVRKGKGSHAIWKHPDYPRPVTVVTNKPGSEVSGTVMKGLRMQMGNERFEEFLKRCS